MTPTVVTREMSLLPDEPPAPPALVRPASRCLLSPCRCVWRVNVAALAVTLRLYSVIAPWAAPRPRPPRHLSRTVLPHGPHGGHAPRGTASHCPAWRRSGEKIHAGTVTAVIRSAATLKSNYTSRRVCASTPTSFRRRVPRKAPASAGGPRLPECLAGEVRP